MTIRAGQIAAGIPILPGIASFFIIFCFLEVAEQTFVGGFGAVFLDKEFAVSELQNFFRKLLCLHRHNGGS